jgi:hypothetical protein
VYKSANIMAINKAYVISLLEIEGNYNSIQMASKKKESFEENNSNNSLLN